MSGATSAVMAVAAVAGAAISYTNGQSQKKAAERAAQQAEVNAKKQEKAADEANNAANRKRVDAQGAMDSALQSGREGASGTMLTGTQGVDASQLSLGKNTLLGG